MLDLSDSFGYLQSCNGWGGIDKILRWHCCTGREETVFTDAQSASIDIFITVQQRLNRQFFFLIQIMKVNDA